MKFEDRVGVRSWSWRCGILSAPHRTVRSPPYRPRHTAPSAPHRTVRASRTCKSGLNNAARKTNHPILGAAESLPLLNEEFAKSLFCGGKDSSAPTSNFELQTPNSKLNHHSPPPPLLPNFYTHPLCVPLRPLRTLRLPQNRSAT